MTTTVGRTYGIEIETVGISESRAAQALSDAGINAREAGYSDHGYSAWLCKGDSSLESPNGQSVEVVSPILTWGNPDHYAQVERVMAVLSDAGARVNASTGQHCHIGIGDLSRTEIVGISRYYAATQYSLDRWVAPSRIDSEWARRMPVAGSDWETYFVTRGYTSLGRYSAVNLHPYGDRGTVEFRQRHGSLNARESLTWVGLMLSIVKCGAERELSETLPYLDAAGRSEDGVWTFLADRDALDAHAVLWRDGTYNVPEPAVPSFSRLLTIQGA